MKIILICLFVLLTGCSQKDKGHEIPIPIANKKGSIVEIEIEIEINKFIYEKSVVKNEIKRINFELLKNKSESNLLILKRYQKHLKQINKYIFILKEDLKFIRTF